MKRRATALALSTANPAQMVAHRLSLVVLALLSLTLIFVAKVDQSLVDRISRPVLDVAAPVLEVVSAPAQAFDDAVAWTKEWMAVHDENVVLKKENERLRQWYSAAMALQKENDKLRELLVFQPSQAVGSRTARVISDAGGVFVRSMALFAGAQDGIAEGQAVMAGNALIGRIVDAGRYSSRVLLVTDLNSRVPVALGNSQIHAILAGDNSPAPSLLYLPKNIQVTIGEPVVTSGAGGLIPPGLAIGHVSSAEGGVVRVTPTADFSRLTHVRVFDFPADNPLLREKQAKLAANMTADGTGAGNVGQ